MPFTFSHPAIVLPLKKLSPKYVSMTGLIIGSLLPDFEYFIRMNLQSEYSHTLLGVFYFCLPLGVLLSVLVHKVVKVSLIDNLPSFLYYRFVKYRDVDILSYFKSSWFVLIVSLLIGILFHILWDMFTHPTGFFVDLFPLLGSSIGINVFQIPVFKILQHGSSLLGGLFIVWVVYKLPQEKYSSPNVVDVKYWVLIFAVTLLIIFCRLFYKLTFLIGNLIVITVSALLLSTIIVSLYWKLRRQKCSRG